MRYVALILLAVVLIGCGYLSWTAAGRRAAMSSSENHAGLPQRIVIANTGAADILSKLIDLKRIAAVPDQVEMYAADGEFWKAHREIPRFDKFQAEIILSFKPDLVVSSAMQDSGAAEAIKQQKIPILYLKDFDSIDGIRNSIRTIGETVGARDAAEKMIAEFDARLAKVKTNIGDAKPVPVVIYSNFGTGYTVGSGTCQNDLLRAAGGLNLAAESGMRGNVPLTFEQLLKFDPEFILVMGNVGLESPQAKLILNDPVLTEMRAVKNRHIAVVPAQYFDALSQYAPEAVEIIAHGIHSRQ